MTQVWIKQSNVDWRKVFESKSYLEAASFATNKITHGNNVERIEIREDNQSTGQAIFDRRWPR